MLPHQTHGGEKQSQRLSTSPSHSDFLSSGMNYALDKQEACSLFLAKEEVLALLRPALLSVALLQRVVVDGRRIPR